MFQRLWPFGLTFPDHDRLPAEFAQGALMQHVAGGLPEKAFPDARLLLPKKFAPDTEFPNRHAEKCLAKQCHMN